MDPPGEPPPEVNGTHDMTPPDVDCNTDDPVAGEVAGKIYVVDAVPVNLKPVYAVSPELKALSSYPDLAPILPATLIVAPKPAPPVVINPPSLEVVELAVINTPNLVPLYCKTVLEVPESTMFNVLAVVLIFVVVKLVAVKAVPERTPLKTYKPDIPEGTVLVTYNEPPIPTPPATIKAPVVVEIDVFEFANMAAPD